jgi:hypothetical protein
MGKWEYRCLIYGPSPVLYSPSPSGPQGRVAIKPEPQKGDTNSWDAVLRTLAQLGREGWDLVDTQGLGECFYFLLKRPLAE